MDIEEEKKKAKIWMIISVIAILIGVTLLVIVVIMLVNRSKPKQCPTCIISPANLESVDKAAKLLEGFKDTIKSLARRKSSCNPLSVEGTCDIPMVSVKTQPSLRSSLRPYQRPSSARSKLRFSV